MEEKIAIVNEMVSMGYHLFEETPEHFANRFTLNQLRTFKIAFESFAKLNKKSS